MKRWTNIVRVIIAAGLFGWLCLSATEVYANTIICGKQLCTVGKKNDNGIYQRICWEIKNKNRGKCDYKCQGFGEVPSDCKKKDKYECKRYAKSQQNCSAANGGRSIDPNNKPYEYRNYREASYTKYEKNNMPKCENVAAGSTLCMCHESWKGDVVCKAGQICKHSEMVQTNAENMGYDDWYCQNKEAAIAGGNSSMTTSNSVSATDGYDVQSQIDANTDDYGVDNDCRTVAQLQERYTSGCWSCLVVGKLTEAFLRVAQAGLEVAKEAGLKLLFLGFILWLVFWALKNVSSFTEVKGGNILNDLLKTCAKVVIAYFCINAGAVAIRNYVVTPIMGVGATMAQYFWSQNTSVNATGKSVKDYTEDFNWDDTFEPDDPGMVDEMNGIVDENNGGTGEDDENGDGIVEEPTEVTKDDIEEIVIDLQNAFMNILRQQLSEIKNSCTTRSPCGSCRYKSCEDPGHRNYIKDIMANAGYGKTVDHYCQASITAAMNKLHKQVGGKVTALLAKARASCSSGIKLGAVGNILLCKNGRQVYNRINVADTVYYNEVQELKNGRLVSHNMGGGSGHHAVTYAGGGSTISFNGDNAGSLCNNYYYNVMGKVLCVSCLLRAELKKGLGGLDVKKLKKLASGATQSYINYEGGKFTNANLYGEEEVIHIPDYEYRGPTGIMPKSVINSMLGATKSITDTTAQLMVLGNMAMCYSNMAGGGAWAINLLSDAVYITNIFMWLDGAILWILGFVLTCIVAYYLIDISFKLGLAVLALPIVMGLWPYKITQGKLATVIAIIAKTSALFAFLALTTYYAIELIAYSLGGDSGISGIYSEYDSIINHTVSGDERDEVIAALDDHFQLFSANFVLMLFGCIYGFKLIRKTTDDLVEKFYPDSVFKGQNPMHSKATAVAGMANKLNQKWGTGLVKDIAANKVGKGVTKLGGKGLRAASNVTHSIAGGTKKLLGSGKGGSRP